MRGWLASAPIVRVSRGTTRDRQVNRAVWNTVANGIDLCGTQHEHRWFSDGSAGGFSTTIGIRHRHAVSSDTQASTVLRRWLASAPIIRIARCAAGNRQVDRAIGTAIAGGIYLSGTQYNHRWLADRNRSCFGAAVRIRYGNGVDASRQTTAILRRRLASAPVIRVSRRAAGNRQVDRAVCAAEAGVIDLCRTQYNRRWCADGNRSRFGTAVCIGYRNVVDASRQTTAILRRRLTSAPVVEYPGVPPRNRQVDGAV